MRRQADGGASQFPVGTCLTRPLVHLGHETRPCPVLQGLGAFQKFPHLLSIPAPGLTHFQPPGPSPTSPFPSLSQPLPPSTSLQVPVFLWRPQHPVPTQGRQPRTWRAGRRASDFLSQPDFVGVTVSSLAPPQNREAAGPAGAEPQHHPLSHPLSHSPHAYTHSCLTLLPSHSLTHIPHSPSLPRGSEHLVLTAPC